MSCGLMGGIFVEKLALTTYPERVHLSNQASLHALLLHTLDNSAAVFCPDKRNTGSLCLAPTPYTGSYLVLLDDGRHMIYKSRQ